MRCYHALIEADLRREYDVRLTDLWRGRITLREMRVMLDGLSPESALMRSFAHGWSLSDVLTGRLLDQVTFGRWETNMARSDDQQRRKLREDEPVTSLPSDEPDDNGSEADRAELRSALSRGLM